jgi:hypothetical protein
MTPGACVGKVGDRDRFVGTADLSLVSLRSMVCK